MRHKITRPAIIISALCAAAAVVLYCTEFEFNNPVDPTNHVTYYCPDTCAAQTGASRPSHCFAAQTECLASGEIDTLPPTCTPGINCPTDVGSCTVGGTCTNNVQRVNCAGQFDFGTSCPVPGIMYYCLTDCNPVPAHQAPPGATCFMDMNTCILNRQEQTYTYFCTSNNCVASTSTSPTPPAGCFTFVGAGGCQVIGSDTTGSCTVGGVCTNNVVSSACMGTFVAGGTCPVPVSFCCFPGECHEIDPTATWDDAITSEAVCRAYGGTVSATDTPPTLDGWCGWGTPSNPSPSGCLQVSASLMITDDAGTTRNQVQNCQVNSFTQTVYATEAECHAAMLGLAGQTEYFCMWASAGNIACHVLTNPTGPPPAGTMCSEGTVPCATALQNCTENGLQNSPYSSLTACNAAIPPSLEYCDWGVWNGTTGGCYPIGNAEQRANCVANGTVVTTCPRGEGQF